MQTQKPLQVGQVVYVSVFNRLRQNRPYCKPHKVVEVGSTYVKTAPISYEDVPGMWLKFGKHTRVCRNRQSKFIYEIFNSIDAFQHAERNGHFKGIR